MFIPRVGVCFFLGAFLWTSVSANESLFGCDVNIFAQSEMTSSLTSGYGSLDSSNIMMFQNEQDFKKFNDKISNIFSEFKKNREYDSLSNYLRFYRTYRALEECPGYTGFQSFYQRYLMENFPYEEAGGNAIQLMKILTKQVPGMAQSAYFVARSDFSGVKFQSLRRQITRESMSLPDFFINPEQIGVVIKYRIEGAFGNGLMILDPELPMGKPAVFRLDSNPSVGQVKVDKVQFTIVESFNKPLADSQFMTASIQHGISDGPAMYDFHVYDIKNPYCTFVETTMKSSLLGFKHSKEVLDSNGMSSAKLIANIGLSEGGQKSTFSVKLLFHDQNLTKTVIIPRMKYRYDDSQESISDDLKIFCERTGKNSGDCVDSLTKDIQVLQSIDSDRLFLLQCEGLKTKDFSDEDEEVDEENSSWAVLSELDPEARDEKKKSFIMPTEDMLWKSFERADQKSRCESYGYGGPYY